ncbi:hypothetical protein LCGC14_1883270, partial [marine sediment metagenome]
SRILHALPGLIHAALGKVTQLRDFQDHRIGAYKATEIGHPQAHDLIVAALDDGVISSSKIRPVLAEWRNPSHPEFADGLTGWRLLNAFTEVLKPRERGDDLQTLPAKTERLHAILDVACRVAA